MVSNVEFSRTKFASPTIETTGEMCILSVWITTQMVLSTQLAQ